VFEWNSEHSGEAIIFRFEPTIMIDGLKLIKKVPVYPLLGKWWYDKKQARRLKNWENSGRPDPPPDVLKRKVLRNYAEQYKLKIFVETGTCFGGMVEAMKEVFERIYSIELGQDLFEKAKERFKSEKHIEIIQGDSGKQLRNVMTKIDKPALFWLDAHYSTGVTARGEKDTPIFEELRQILAHQDLGHVIVIDDARFFGVDPAYPTIDELKEFVLSKRNNIRITVEHDSIRIVPHVCAQNENE